MKSFCQVNYIYLDEIDSILVSSNNYDTPLFDFEDKMPNGQWLVLNFERAEKIPKTTEDQILISGNFKDSLRDGIFKYNLRCLEGKRIVIKEGIICYYKNGLLHGYYISKNCNGQIIKSGWYDNGRKNGFFSYYYSSGNIKSIVLYQNDTITNWSYYHENGILYKNGTGALNNKNGIIYIYDNDGMLLKTEQYLNNELIGFVEYEKNGHIKREANGVFRVCYDIEPEDIPPCITYCHPVDGYIKYYNSNDSTVHKIDYFKDAILIKTVFNPE